jgi:hypothetical protein
VNWSYRPEVHNIGTGMLLPPDFEGKREIFTAAIGGCRGHYTHPEIGSARREELAKGIYRGPATYWSLQ